MASPNPASTSSAEESQYMYEGELDVDELREFAMGKYLAARVQHKVLEEPSGISNMWSRVVESVENTGEVLDAFLIKDD
eukprot:CAMPEP_0202959874 /NCGR_PEP_ID=MMETSP1396-20130829/4059_1 /ASSEMBLY_ACC=CAM_ASM_000872 /TAXON_ID= /ORGANISM="Pseudokeronopsis sp., Strain Brazil" /LENGTH=78 /DNA_ID=CAMNT_0049678723 /DNA_START=291 /DNA_END=526 /DNA_ORIENTATION=+